MIPLKRLCPFLDQEIFHALLCPGNALFKLIWHHCLCVRKIERKKFYPGFRSDQNTPIRIPGFKSSNILRERRRERERNQGCGSE